MLKFLDIYGEELKLRLNSKEKVKSTTGGMLTILTCIIVIVSGWLLGNDVVYRLNPRSYLENVISPFRAKITIDKESYPLAFNFVDVNGAKINDNRMLQTEVVYKTFVRDSSGKLKYNVTILNQTTCTEENFPTLDFKNTTLYSSLIGATCISNQNISIYGYINENSFAFLQINFKLCDYDAVNSNCATKQEIENFVTKRTVSGSLIAYEKLVSTTNYTNPIQVYSNVQHNYLHMSFTKIIEFFLQNNTLKTDSGFFAESIDLQHYVALEALPTDFYPINSGKSLLTFSLYSSNKSIINRRSYIKVTEIFGSLGGILNLTTLSLFLVNSYFNKIQKILDISNNFSYFTIKKMKNKNFKIFNSNNNNLYNELKANNSELSPANNINNNNNSNYINNFLSSTDKHLKETNVKALNNESLFNKSNIKLTEFKTVDQNQKIKLSNKDPTEKKLTLNKVIRLKLQNFCKSSNKINKDSCNQLDLYNKLNTKILKLLDVSEIFRKIEDIDNIKHTLLDNDLLNIYNTLFNKINCEKEDKAKLDSFINKNNKNPLEIKICELFLLNRLE